MIYNLNNKILEYKSEINKLTNIIENKNNEFKQLKYNIDQINNLFNNKNKNIKNENKDSNLLLKIIIMIQIHPMKILIIKII